MVALPKLLLCSDERPAHPQQLPPGGTLSMASDESQGEHTSPDGVPSEQERIPFMQRVLDNPFLLLFLGVTVPTVFYVIWGVMEIVQIPIAPPQ